MDARRGLLILTALACVSSPAPAAATPVAGKSVDVGPVEFAKAASVKCPGETAFAKVTAPRQIPLGCEVDMTNGALAITSARADGTPQPAEVTGDSVHFKLTQSGDVTVMSLVQPLNCKRTFDPRLFVNKATGAWRTVGVYGSATGVDAQWRMEEGCDATTHFTADVGTLEIRDFPARKTVQLRPQKQYTAGAKSGCRKMIAGPRGADYNAINITVSGVSCASAKKVLTAYIKKLPRFKGSKTKRFPTSSGGWTFDAVPRDVDGGRANATRGVAAIAYALISTFAALP
jgi:hypothetical protein